MNYHTEMNQRGELLLEQLMEALEKLQKAGQVAGAEAYTSYVHGQIYGLATALRVLFPGPGCLGERAALALRPVITEHRCECDDQEGT